MSENNYGALMMKSALSAGIDIDTLLLPGIYPVQSGNSSAPSLNGGVLVIHPESIKTRTFISDSIVLATSIYNVSSSAWGAWNYALPRSEIEAITGAKIIGGLGYVTPEMYRLSADPSDDWRPAIQRMIDAIANGSAETRNAHFGGAGYPVSLDPTSPAVTNAYTIGGVALSVKSALTITGGGRVYLKDGEGSGKEGAIFGNPHVTTLNDVVFDAIEIDGNALNTLGKISGVLLVGAIRPVVRSGVHVHDTTMHGIMMRPNAAQSTGFGPEDVLYDNPQVSNVVGIGLQATRPDGAIISGRVKNTGDNGWDVYGNQSNDANGGYARRVKVGDIQITSALTGGFVESFQDAQVRGTYYDSNGLKLNRIISGAKRVDIQATFSDFGYDSAGTKYGINFGNNSGQAHIHSCTFESKRNSIVSGSGCTQVILRGDCVHRDIYDYIWNYSYSSSSLVRCIIENQTLDATELNSNGWPQLCPPSDHPWYTSSRYQSTIGNLKLINGTIIPSDFTKSSEVLTSPSGWGGAYSIFNVSSDGKTRINTDPDIDTSNYPIVKINGVLYELSSSGTAGEYYVGLWSPTGVTYGDFTTSLNSALTIYLKHEGFKSPVYSGRVFSKTRIMTFVPGWQGYSIYLSGESIVYLPEEGISNGSIAVINGYSYTLENSGTGGQYFVRRWTPSGSHAGDYTKYLSSGYTAYIQ